MITRYTYLFITLFLLSCTKENKENKPHDAYLPTVTNNGLIISFPNISTIKSFETEQISIKNINNEVVAPAKVAATVLKSNEGGPNIILFENPELADNFTQLVQTSININFIEKVNIEQRKIELDRIKDLQKNGAATGKDLLEAETALAMERNKLANEKAGIIEHEAILKAGGFQPQILRHASAGTSYIICDIPENQIGKISEGQLCEITFNAFPNKIFKGNIDGIADMIDETTRMFKLRVTVNNSNNKLKSGMFASVKFNIDEGENINISKNTIVTMQGINYVFIKTSETTFERRKITIGSQIKDRVIVIEGLKEGENVAIKSVMQLKGLSFGY
jgi:hypothetical protein